VIPTSIVLGPHAYEVRADEESVRLLHAHGNRGATYNDQSIVRIDPDRPKTALAETVLHELMHCIVDKSPLRDRFSKEDDEAIVVMMSVGVLELLRRNPELVEFLLS
jgi:hypothetical protein